MIENVRQPCNMVGSSDGYGWVLGTRVVVVEWSGRSWQFQYRDDAVVVLHLDAQYVGAGSQKRILIRAELRRELVSALF